MERFFTNTYSNYVPTKVGDTVQEQALLAQTQANRFDTAKQEYLTNQNALLNLSAGQNRKRFIDQFNKDFDDEFNSAKERGNFEDMVGSANESVIDGYKKYNINNVLRDEAKYQADIKNLDDSDLPQRYKDFARFENNLLNSKAPVDEEGNMQYVPYQGIRNYTYENVAEGVGDYIEGMKADGFITQNPDGSGFFINKQIPGYDNLIKGKQISRQDVERLALDYIGQEANLTKSLEDEATIDVNSLYYNKGRFDLDDVTAVLSKDIPFAKGTKKYNDTLNAYLNSFNEQIELQRKYASENDLPFDEQQSILNTAKQFKVNSLLNKQANIAANKFGFTEIDLIKFKQDLDSSNNSGNTNSNLDVGFFSNPTIGTSDSQPIFNQKRLNENRINLFNGVKALKGELADLEIRAKDDPSINNTMLDSKRSQIAEAEEKLQRMNNTVKASASNAFNVLKNSNIKVRESGQGVFEDKTIDSLEDYQDSSYQVYLKDEQDASQDFDKFNKDTTILEDLYQDINPNYKIEKGTKLNKEQFAELFNSQLNSYLNDGDYSNSFIRNYASGFKNGVDKYKKQNPNNNSLYKSYELFDIKVDEESNKDKRIYRKYQQGLSSIADTIVRDFNNFTDLSGVPISQVLKNNGLELNEDNRKDLEFRLVSTDLNGALVGEIFIPATDAEDKNIKDRQEVRMLVDLTGGNENGKKVNDTVKQIFGDLNLALTETNVETLPKDKRNMLESTNNILNIANGLTEEFSQIPLTTAKEGELHKFGFADKQFDIIPYQNDNTGVNNYLVLDNNTEVYKDGNYLIGKGVLGYGKDLLDSDGNPLVINGKQVSPKYYYYNENSSNNLFERREDGQIQIKDGFIPYEFGHPNKILEKLTLDRAINRGSFNINEVDENLLYPYPNNYFQNNVNPTTINNRVDKLKNSYSKENGYTPLTDVVDANRIGVKVNLPFLALNDEGINRVKYLFNNLGLFVSGGGRDKNNKVEGGADNSVHKSFGALDVIKNKAAAQLIKMTPEQRAKYGISKIIYNDPNHKDHLHIEFDTKYHKKFIEVN